MRLKSLKGKLLIIGILLVSLVFVSFDFSEKKDKINESQPSERTVQLKKDLSQDGDGKAVKEKSIFVLDPKNWDIIEGEVSDNVALQNRLNLEKAFAEAVKNGSDIFKIGKLDAYFNVTTITKGRKRFESWKEAITIPANFNLSMGDETHLRVQPNNSARYSLLSNGTNDNVTITGGHLYGERNAHTYSGKSSDEWGHVLDIIGLENGVVDGLTISNGNGDGMTVHELNFTYDPKHNKTRNLKITNCIFDNNRRNNLAITGGSDILVEKNTFLNAGRDTPTSKGTSPKAAIDVEPYKERSKKTGKLIPYEITEKIIIRNNIEKNSAWQGFVVATGRDVEIAYNTLESSVNFGYSDGVTIHHNTIINPGLGSVGMTLGADGERVFNNKVYNNTIKNFKQGIAVRGNGHSIYNNEIYAFDVGLRVYKLMNSTIYDNRFLSERDKSKGLYIHVTEATNSILKNNLFDVKDLPFKLTNFNFYGNKEETLIIQENTFNSTVAGSISNCNGIEFLNNTLNIGTQIQGSNRILFDKNNISARDRDGILLKEGNMKISLIDNKISSSKKCINLKVEPKEFTDLRNTCNK